VQFVGSVLRRFRGSSNYTLIAERLRVTEGHGLVLLVPGGGKRKLATQHVRGGLDVTSYVSTLWFEVIIAAGFLKM